MDLLFRVQLSHPQDCADRGYITRRVARRGSEVRAGVSGGVEVGSRLHKATGRRQALRLSGAEIRLMAPAT